MSINTDRLKAVKKQLRDHEKDDLAVKKIQAAVKKIQARQNSRTAAIIERLRKEISDLEEEELLTEAAVAVTKHQEEELRLQGKEP